jgi:hypothetical protein
MGIDPILAECHDSLLWLSTLLPSPNRFTPRDGDEKRLVLVFALQITVGWRGEVLGQ